MTAAVHSLWRALWYTRLRDVLRGRFDASLDWRSVIAQSELPAEIQTMIEQVVRRTRLWRSEKRDVATELVAHFQDGIEAGASPGELAESFGDVQQTARLIRRAKKRGRSVLWHLCRYACLALGIVAVAYVVAALWMMLDRPTVKTDYLAILNEPAAAVPEEQRAWPLYREALLALDAKQMSDTTSPYVAAANSTPGSESWEQTVQFLNDHASAFAKLRDAAARPELGFIAHTLPGAFSPEDRKLFGMEVTAEQLEAAEHQSVSDRFVISTLLPHLDRFRSAAQLLANDARRAAAAGDSDTAFANIIAIYGMSHHAQEIPFFVSLLVADAIQQQARATIQDILRDTPDLLTNAQLRDLAHRTASTQINWRRGFDGERASFYDSMQRIYTDDGDGDGRLALNVDLDMHNQANLFQLLNSVVASVSTSSASQTPFSNPLLAALAMPATNMLVASRKEMVEMYDRFSNQALSSLETPLWESSDEPTVEEQLDSLTADPIDRLRYLFVDLLTPAYETLKNRYAASQGERDGLLLGLALELYHREHNKWPASLDELSPRWIPELPVDRISGTPLKLAIVDDRPVVYGLGVDGKDDGGKLPAACEGDPSRYPVSSPNEWKNADATQDTKDRYYGDWVIWSTAKSK